MKARWPAAVAGTLVALATCLAGWRWLDHRADREAWEHLIRLASSEPRAFTPDLVAGLPEPARRYFAFTIAPGTPLRTVVEIGMQGEIGLGTREAPGYRPMTARQVLAPPHGLVWQLESGAMAGSDAALPGRSWTRFWLFGLLPVVRASGPDHLRSAFGRVVAEGAFWVPASLLPGGHVRWKPLDENSARATVSTGGLEQSVDITVDEHGAPTKVVIQRWSNVNAEQAFRAQPFGGHLSRFEWFDGYRLPTHVEGGNHIGTPAYFPFFKADVTAIRYPAQEAPR